MRTTTTRSKITLLFMAFAIVLALPTAAFADDVANTLDTDIDSTYEVMAVDKGKTNTTQLYVKSTDGDGKSGCNITGNDRSVVVSLKSSDTNVATVSPSSVTFDNCVDKKLVNVTGVNQGSALIQATLTSNTSQGSVTVTGADFKVNVIDPPPANTAPQVSVTGVEGGDVFEKGSVPEATCSVVDAEDGNKSFPATLSDTLDANGYGSQTATCSYTDGGGVSASASKTYSVTETKAPSSQHSLSSDANANGWHKQDVTVNLSASDDQGGSGVKEIRYTVNGGAEQVAPGSSKAILVDAEGTTSISYYAVDNFNNAQSPAKSATVKLDKSAPTNVAGTPDGPANAAGWYNAPVAIDFSGTDALSGIANCSSATYNGSDNGAASVGGSCTDKAGNSANGSFGLKYDSTAPTVTVGDPTTNANAAGWYKGAVTNNFSASDALSGLANEGQASFQNSSGAREEGDAVRIGSGNVADKAGNVASKSAGPFQIDMTAPSVTNNGPTTNANAAGWYKTDVTNNFSASDALSGLADAADATIARTTQGEGRALKVASGAVTDKAGNVAASVESAPFDIDQTRPVIAATGTVNGTAGTNGWYKSAISVEFRASDGLSGFSDKTDSHLFTQSSGTQQGDAVAVNSGPVADKAGNAAVTVNDGPFKIDYTLPKLAPTISPSVVALNGAATADAGATDDHSGIATAGCGTVDTSSVGTKTGVSCSATDKAGNGNTGSTPSYSVVYGSGFAGFLQPINGGLTASLTTNQADAAFGDDNSRFKVGSTVPVKFSLVDAKGNPVTDAVARLNVRRIDNTADAGVDESLFTTTPSDGNQFRLADATTGQYIFNLSTKTSYTNPNGTSVTFGQGTYTLTALLNDGTTRSVNIQLVK